MAGNEEVSGQIEMASLESSVVSFSSLSRLRSWFVEKRSKIRPWSEFLDVNRFSKPKTSSEIYTRFTKNVELYQANYVFIFVGLALYCILTSPLLLIALSISGGASWYINHINKSKPLSIAGREFSLAEQYGLVALICLPLFFLASAGSTVFWILGASFFVIAIHASLFTLSTPEEISDVI
ncbi:prenylated Rab acceptor protein 1-like [Xenia sp. Carnegie-2017]|uniref:prenylated Rab acceptor protein 1-like n=1 Tax=Xenia sp. Carnegie-2017 TaxID=2897299 RepID=UPI001F04BC00|nr:prenylated Rab acceptor protein 1-like [Xenia sp. Carnegie-2017]